MTWLNVYPWVKINIEEEKGWFILRDNIKAVNGKKKKLYKHILYHDKII